MRGYARTGTGFRPALRRRTRLEGRPVNSDFGWSKYTGTEGENIGIKTFGALAPIKQLLKKFGFTADHIVAAARNQILHQKAQH
jgi:transketolase